ncbi:hypothetical protein JCM11251_002877 [Rhodosporidiobolus azoricus]
MSSSSMYRTASRTYSFKRRTTEARRSQGNRVVMWILAILLPFIPVAIKTRSAADTIINVCLLCLGYFPAIIHAFYILLRKPHQPRQVVVVQQVPSPAPVSYPPSSYTPSSLPSPQPQTSRHSTPSSYSHPYHSEPFAKKAPIQPYFEEKNPFADDGREQEQAPDYIDYRAQQTQAYADAQEAAGKWKVV